MSFIPSLYVILLTVQILLGLAIESKQYKSHKTVIRSPTASGGKSQGIVGRRKKAPKETQQRRSVARCEESRRNESRRQFLF